MESTPRKFSARQRLRALVKFLEYWSDAYGELTAEELERAFIALKIERKTHTDSPMVRVLEAIRRMQAQDHTPAKPRKSSPLKASGAGRTPARRRRAHRARAEKSRRGEA